MMKYLLNIGVTILSIFLSIIFLYVIYFHLFLNLGPLTFKYFQKYLAFNITPFDQILVQFSPLLFIFPIVRAKIDYSKNMLRTTLLSLLCIFLFLMLGLIIGIYTWQHDTTNPLLPEYLVVQPFKNYWTIFILMGLFFPIYKIVKKRSLN